MKYLFTFTAVLLLSLNAQAQIDDWVLDSTVLTGRELVDDLEIPWEILYGADDYLYITERQGKVWRIEPNSGNKVLLLDITGRVTQSGTEPGMLGMVFHPDYPSDNRLYVVYNWTDSERKVWERLSSFAVTADSLENERILIDSIPGFRIHNGSRLVIGMDEKIYMTTGDYGQPNTALDTSSLNGKLLRINLDGTVPQDNPISGSYVYTIGHRNAQGLYQADNGILYSTEHGPDNSDEINIMYPLRNYGWPIVEGVCDESRELDYCDEANVAEPVWEWIPTVAVNDLVYYDHPAIPEFQNCLLVAVLGGRQGKPGLYQMPLSVDGLQVLDQKIHLDFLGRVRDLCFNPDDGAIYVIDNGNRYPGTTPNSILEYKNLNFVANGERFEEELKFSYMPGRALIEISQAGNSYQHFNIYNFAGHKVDSGLIQGPVQKIDLEALQIGAYIFRASGPSGHLFTRKFIKQ